MIDSQIPKIQIIFDHMPKTGGVSFLAQLVEKYGKNRVLIHNRGEGMRLASENPNLNTSKAIAQLRQVIRVSLSATRIGREIARRLSKSSDEIKFLDGIPSDITVIAGHFKPEDREKYFNMFPEAKKIVFIREPFELARSLYVWLETKRDYKIAPEGYIPGMTFSDFLKLQSVLSYQSDFISPFSLNEYDIVLTTEHLNETLHELFPGIKGDVPKLNASVKIEATDLITQEEIDAFRKNSKDNFLYEIAQGLERKYLESRFERLTEMVRV